MGKQYKKGRGELDWNWGKGLFSVRLWECSMCPTHKYTRMDAPRPKGFHRVKAARQNRSYIVCGMCYVYNDHG